MPRADADPLAGIVIALAVGHAVLSFNLQFLTFERVMRENPDRIVRSS